MTLSCPGNGMGAMGCSPHRDFRNPRVCRIPVQQIVGGRTPSEASPVRDQQCVRNARNPKTHRGAHLSRVWRQVLKKGNECDGFVCGELMVQSRMTMSRLDDNATNGKSCRGLLQYLHRVRYFFRGLCVKDVPEYATKLISAISMTAIHRSGFCRGERRRHHLLTQPIT